MLGLGHCRCCIFTPDASPLHAGAVNITGVTTNPEAIETPPGVACLAVVRPYATWAPTVNSSSAQPTPSPVPPYVEGAIDFAIINESPVAVDVPWLIGIYNPLYTEVLQAS